MAWIRTRETKDGRKRHEVQWRDDRGRIRSKTLPTTDPRLMKLHLRAAHKQEGKRGRMLAPGEDGATLLRQYLDEPYVPM